MLIYFFLAFNIIFEKGDRLTEKRRIHTLDEIRGFCVFCMVFDHALFTLGYMFGHGFSRAFFDILAYISPAFAAAFVLICGISCALSRNNLLRGIRMLIAGLAVTLVSLLIMSDMPIIFGILHMLGVCVLLYIPLRKAIDKIPTPLGIILCAVLFLLTYSVESGSLGIAPFTVDLPRELYTGHLMILGFRSFFASYSDYFPLLPWMFAFFAGAFIGKYVRDGKVPESMYRSRIPFFSMLGENAFFVYLAHQPLIFGVYYLISLIGGI